MAAGRRRRRGRRRRPAAPAPAARATCRSSGAAPRPALAAVPRPRRLVDRHGTDAPAVLALAAGNPELLGARRRRASTCSASRCSTPSRAEGALDADDVLDRRTRIGLVPADRERAAARVEALVEAELAVSLAG